MIQNIFIFAIVLSILVLVHELGHYIAARLSGIWVEEFGFGLPPRLFGKKIGETLYSINLLPFGGFVKLHGENLEDKLSQPKRAFYNAGKLSRIFIVCAGVIMNFLLAVFVFAVVYSVTGITRPVGYVAIEDIQDNSPASSSNLMVGDILRKVDGVNISSNGEFIRTIQEKDGAEAVLSVERRGESGLVDIVIKPRVNPPEGEGALGVVITDSEIYFPPYWQRPFYGVYEGVKESLYWGKTVLQGLGKIVTDLFGGSLPKDIAGPAGLFVITSEVAKVGILALLNWLGIISINLAVFNIMPLPALDGGKLVFIAVERLFGRRVLPKVESWLQIISLSILVLFLLAVTAREITLIYRYGFSGYLDYLSQGQGIQ